MMKKTFKSSIEYCNFLEQYEWQIATTLTPNFFMSQNAIFRAMKRCVNFMEKEVADYRMFWVVEPYASHGHHIHLVAWFDGNGGQEVTVSARMKMLEKCWQKAIGSSRKTINKSRKHIKGGEWLLYILKEIYMRKTLYDFEGNAWGLVHN